MPNRDELANSAECIGRETLTVSNAAVGFASIPSDAVRADCQCLTANIRVTVDGTDPVASTTGRLVYAGQNFQIDGNANINKFRAIRDTGTDGEIQTEYY